MTIQDDILHDSISQCIHICILTTHHSYNQFWQFTNHFHRQPRHIFIQNNFFKESKNVNFNFGLLRMSLLVNVKSELLKQILNFLTIVFVHSPELLHWFEIHHPILTFKSYFDFLQKYFRIYIFSVGIEFIWRQNIQFEIRI